MAMTPRLDLRQSQALVMTPQLQQAIKLLQLNNLELTAFVEQELEKNPLLDREDADGPDAADQPDAASETAADEGGLATMDLGDGDKQQTAASEAMDSDYDNTFNNDSVSDAPVPDGNVDPGPSLGGASDWASSGGGFDGEGPDWEGMLSDEVSLRDHLIEQIGVELSDPAERVIATHLMEMLDDAGYINGELDPVAEALGCDTGTVEAVLARLQHFDPPGLFARDLSECLALQLREKNRLDPAMQTLLDNLDLLARRDMGRLRKICGVDDEDLLDMIAEIRALDPKPAHAFDHSVIQPVVPDVLMRPQAGGGWLVELNAETLPRVLVNNQYYAKINADARSSSEKQYINECYQSANWLTRALHQRATTILKVASELVAQQDAFFAKGVQFLRPLVLRDIADAIEMHESTVSRVTSNKYIATPRGIFELKYFFTTALGNADGGEAHSSESVRHRIRALIDVEVPNKILSDDKLVAILKAEGIDIARRTVAKYRESMGIGSSVQRRREKKSGI